MNANKDGGTQWSVRTHVIQFGGSSVNANNAAIAAAGGTTPILAIDDAGVSEGLARIVSGWVLPELCDNVDNNCNGCTDEGFVHYCNRKKTSRTIAEIDAETNKGRTDLCCSGPRGTSVGAPDVTTCLGRVPCSARGSSDGEPRRLLAVRRAERCRPATGDSLAVPEPGRGLR